MTRGSLAALVLAAIAALFVWQYQRSGLVQTCAASGGVWDGATSTCRPAPQSPILQRDIRRS